MPLSDVIFNKAKNGLGRELPGEDHISGFLFYGTKPTEFSTSNEVQVFSIEEAEDLGIVSADYPVEHYHVSEYFRLNPSGNLWIGIYVAGETLDFSEIKDLQRAASGSIRQVGIFTTEDFDTSMISAIKTAVDVLESEHMPLSVLLAANLSGVSLSAFPDLKTSNAPKVSVVIGQSGKGTGADLYNTSGKSVTCLGALLGATSKAKVHENIGWVEVFDVSGTELDVIAFANGTSYKTVSRAQLTALENSHYTFLLKHTGYNGSFFNYDYTATTGDYERLAFNRAIDKAVRGIRAALLPSLNSPVYVDPTSGKLSQDTIDNLEVKGQRPVTQMVTDGELSGALVVINPAQDVLSTDEIAVSVGLVPVGSSKNIVVNIGFKPKL